MKSNPHGLFYLNEMEQKEWKISSKTYYAVKGWMIIKLGLTKSHLHIYAIIYGFSQNNQGFYVGSKDYLAQLAGIKRRSAINVVKDLVREGYLIESGKRNQPKYKVNYDLLDDDVQKMHTLNGVQKLHGRSAKNAQDDVQKMHTKGAKNAHNIKEISNLDIKEDNTVKKNDEEKNLSSKESSKELTLKFGKKIFLKINPTYIWSSQDLKSMRYISNKIRKRKKALGEHATEKEIQSDLKFFLENIPKFYKSKELKTIDSNFNSIAAEAWTPKEEEKEKFVYQRPKYFTAKD